MNNKKVDFHILQLHSFQILVPVLLTQETAYHFTFSVQK